MLQITFCLSQYHSRNYVSLLLEKANWWSHLFHRNLRELLCHQGLRFQPTVLCSKTHWRQTKTQNVIRALNGPSAQSPQEHLMVTVIYRRHHMHQSHTDSLGQAWAAWLGISGSNQRPRVDRGMEGMTGAENPSLVDENLGPGAVKPSLRQSANHDGSLSPSSHF